MKNSIMSMIIVKKRERTQNWAPEEKNILLSLIKPLIGKIENKKIDAAATALKNQAWDQIHDAFRGRFSTDRDLTRIKEQWRRMKAQTKSEMMTFAERVRINPEEASRCRPSALSLEISRLLDNLQKLDGEIDPSDESNGDGSNKLLNILDKYAVVPSVTEATLPEIKQEQFSDDYSENGTTIESVMNEFRQRRSKRTSEKSLEKSKTIAQKKPRNNDDDIITVEMSEFDEDLTSNHSQDIHRESNEDEELTRHAEFMFSIAQKEHKLKMHILELEMQRAELQKQSAFNELKASETKRELIEAQATEYYNQVRMIGEPGSGAGKGGGGGGSIREAGGSFGKMEAAHEDQYFHNVQKEQLKKLREGLHDEISFHEEQIKRHQEAIDRHKKRITDMDKH